MMKNSPNSQLIDLEFVGDSPDVTGIDLEVGIPATGKAETIGLRNLGGTSGSAKGYAASLGLLIDGAAADTVKVVGVMRASGAPGHNCGQNVVNISDPAGKELPHGPVGSAGLPAMAAVFPAQFTSAVRPRYPASEMRSHTSGYASLLFQRDPSGKPTNVSVIDASDDRGFLDAAKDALAHSTLASPASADEAGRMYRVDYNFYASQVAR